MKIYQLAKGVCKTYKNTVKGNEYLSYEVIQRKLTRNILLGRKIGQHEKNVNVSLYIYGRLEILVDEVENKILWIRNKRIKPRDSFVIDQEKKREIEIELGLIGGIYSYEQ